MASISYVGVGKIVEVATGVMGLVSCIFVHICACIVVGVVKG